MATTSASAAPTQEQAQAVGFLIPADMNNRCLTVAQGNTGNGAGLMMLDCTGSPAQRWSWQGESLRSDVSGKCLDVAFSNGDNGGMLNMFECHGDWPAQRWHWNGNELRNRINEKCLTIPGANWWQGATVSLWDCVNAREQKWHTS
ncbi:RICIN domain-containing protein [Lentzea sp. NPDC051838]|uniref:RICIN domain-containing protein n=1 Tax=Lentzea sp. NPDC051838 TaxID=3154849 RepID=UPI003444B6C4